MQIIIPSFVKSREPL